MRQPWWPDGLYQDDYFRCDLDELDRQTFNSMLAALGRNEGPALLFDLVHGGSLDLTQADMAGVVADVWSDAEYPLRAMEPDLWIGLFRTNGYTHNGTAATPPAESVTLCRGCTHDGIAGMSWTDDPDVASRFAVGRLRGRPVGCVYTASIQPNGLLAYINGEDSRGESELTALLLVHIQIPRCRPRSHKRHHDNHNLSQQGICV